MSQLLYETMHLLNAFWLIADLPVGQSQKIEGGGRGCWSILSEITQPRMMEPNGRRREKAKLSDTPEALKQYGINKILYHAGTLHGGHLNL